MINRLVLFFALLLPIQWVWSAASASCGHESGSSSQARHFGHHDHAHPAESAPASTLAGDPDCATCHAASTPCLTAQATGHALLPASRYTATELDADFSSATARAPDRPQWLRLV